MLVFDWGKDGVERLTVRETVGRLKARLHDIAVLKKRQMQESRSFVRAVAYTTGLQAYYGRELNAAELHLRNRRAAALNEVKKEAARKKAAA